MPPALGDQQDQRAAVGVALLMIVRKAAIGLGLADQRRRFEMRGSRSLIKRAR